jgi:hypothetical protein
MKGLIDFMEEKTKGKAQLEIPSFLRQLFEHIEHL